MCPDLSAAVPLYGAAPKTEDAVKSQAPWLIKLAENDSMINAMWPGFEAMLKSNQKLHVRYLYPDTRHGFHNNSTPRYDEKAA
jgi:carboxymethylenebutenolidase